MCVSTPLALRRPEIPIVVCENADAALGGPVGEGVVIALRHSGCAMDDEMRPRRALRLVKLTRQHGALRFD